MLTFCPLISLLIIIAQAEFLNNNGAYIYIDASELSNLTCFPEAPVYFANFTKLQNISHRNGAYKYLYDSSQVTMDHIVTALETYRHHNPNTTVSSFIQNTEANGSYRAGPANSSVGTMAQAVVSVLQYVWPRFHLCGATYKTIGNSHFRIQTCSASKTCDIPTDIIKAEEEGLERHTSSMPGWYRHDYDSTWRSCVSYYQLSE